MSIRKILIIALCLIMVVGISVLGTMAYLADQTDAVKNTFTMGKVDIGLDEAKVDLYGNPVDGEGNPVDDVEDAERVLANSYKMIPGQTYTKDPTVTVKADSEESYVRMWVTFNHLSALDEIFAPDGGANLMQLFNGYDSELWIHNGSVRDAEADTVTHEFRYYQPVSAADTDVKLEALFDTFTVPGTFTADDLDKLNGTDENDPFEITVVGHAIQAIGFEDDAASGKTASDLAWEAFDAQLEADAPANP